MSASATQGGYN